MQATGDVALDDVRNVINFKSGDVTVVSSVKQTEAFSVHTRARAFQLMAESADEREEWVQAIRFVRHGVQPASGLGGGGGGGGHRGALTWACMQDARRRVCGAAGRALAHRQSTTPPHWPPSNALACLRIGHPQGWPVPSRNTLHQRYAGRSPRGRQPSRL